MKHLKALIIIAFVAFCIPTSILAKSLNRDTSKTKYTPPVIVKDNPIAATLDSLSVSNCFKKSNSSKGNKIPNKYNYTPDFIPTFDDSIYALRIAKLNAKSPFGLVYNDDVKVFINLYAVKKRQMTCRILGLAEYYFPLFEKYLDKYHIPLEMKYLAVVESALNPLAKSPASANGLWQFIYSTGKMYDLNVTSYVDDRFDPIKSTIAACEHFTDLYAIYKDWSLVLAAYNSGPGNVNKAIRKANGEMDFWKIKKYLPIETQSYVPAFIAVTYVMNYPSEHNLFAVKPDFCFYEIDSVTVKQRLTFDQISEALNIPIEDIKYLNPCYKEGVIPAFADEKYILQLPQKYIGDFITNEKSLYAYKTKAMLEEERILALKQKEIHLKDSLLALQKLKNKKNYTATNNIEISNNSKSTVSDNQTANTYTVKTGDGLGVIAYKYNCTVAQLQSWNKMNNMNIYPGQKLYVQDPSKVTTKVDSNLTKTDIKASTSLTKDKEQTEIVTNNTTISNSSSKITSSIEAPLTYTVKAGDGLGIIAYKYKCSITQLQKWNKMNNMNIYPGQKLYIQDPSKVTANADSNVTKTDVKTVTTSTNNQSQTVDSNNNQIGKTKYVYHTVQKGDTLWGIASQYKGVSVEEIKKLNNLTNNSLLYVGQKLKVAKAS